MIFLWPLVIGCPFGTSEAARLSAEHLAFQNTCDRMWSQVVSLTLLIRQEESMEKLTIRSAELRDIDDIQRLYRQLDGHHADLLPDVFRPLEGDARADAFIRTRIHREDASYLLAELDGAVAGFVDVQRAAYPDYPMFRSREFCLIDNLIVDEPHRGKGIGKRLFEAAIDWTRDHGLRCVQTTVWDANARARDFYLEQGFAPATLRLELALEEDTEPTIPAHG
jgi:GNAT superfamily N-acetyltransferase